MVNFRGDLIKVLVAAGHDVVAMGDDTDDVTRNRIETLGVSFRPYPVQRNGMNPRNDMATLRALRTAFDEIAPDVVLAYTIKPVIWSGLALRTLKTSTQFYAMITGLGLAFQPGGIKQTALRSLVACLYRSALVRAERVIFQNTDNRQVFIDRQIVNDEKCVTVNGSGVNLAHFDMTCLPKGDVVFLTIARLLGDKGLREYVEAAEIVKKRYPRVVFNLLGPADPSPDGISPAEVESWQSSGHINYLGASNDVRPFITHCHVYVLPSYHEGMPRTVLEAMSMGRPILTTDVPGCRETVISGENGYLVPPKNSRALAEKMIMFIENRHLWERMGHASRRIAENRFDVTKINSEMLDVMALNTSRGHVLP
nr:glycosyltransferase family 4 protein [Pelotalea chapellei]